MSANLLPQNISSRQAALADAVDLMPDLLSSVEYISGWKHILQPADLRPFLINEYGLEALLPYLESHADILSQGLPWARIRGTHGCVSQGLSMVGYTGSIINPPARRRAWAEFQINLDRVRETRADLERINGIVDLSIPTRSTFRRGVHGYDIPAAEASRTKLSGSIFSNDSGARLGSKGPKWSFGRSYEFDHTLTESELTTLGIWIPEFTSDAWLEMDFPWLSANFAWLEDAERSRRAALASSIRAIRVILPGHSCAT